MFKPPELDIPSPSRVTSACTFASVLLVPEMRVAFKPYVLPGVMLTSALPGRRKLVSGVGVTSGIGSFELPGTEPAGVT